MAKKHGGRTLVGLGGCFLVAAGLLGLAGCGTPTGQVTGKVFWNQKPVPRAELLFEATADAQLQFFGNSDEEGKYHVSYRTFKGLPVGRYKVTITNYTLPGGKPLPEGEKGRVLIDGGKAVQTAFTFEENISQGMQTLDFELSRGQKQKN